MIKVEKSKHYMGKALEALRAMGLMNSLPDQYVLIALEALDEIE